MFLSILNSKVIYVRGVFMFNSDIDIYSLKKVSGGKNTICTRPSEFKLLDCNKSDWEKGGCHKVCKYCWHLSYRNGFFCNA